MAETAGRRGLGRGLSALLGETDAAAAPMESSAGQGGENLAPIELLRANPAQPRRAFDEGDLDQLAQSIRDKGVLQPLLVRPAPGAPGEYQIVAGERRWRAAQRAGLRSLPIVVRTDLDELDVLEIGVIENVQRADLRPLEEAAAYRTLMERFGRTQEEVAKTVGKSRSHIANTIRLLSLPTRVANELEAGRITAGHARAIANAAEPEKLADQIVARDLSVRQAEALARRSHERSASPARARAKAKDADTRALEQDLCERLGLTVEIADKGGKGELRIGYGSLDQLDELCRLLSGGPR